MTTAVEIKQWLQDRVWREPEGATHMLVMCDGFDHEDYPVYVLPGEDVHTVIKSKLGNMQRLMECYSFALPIDAQLHPGLVHNYEVPTPEQLDEQRRESREFKEFMAAKEAKKVASLKEAQAKEDSATEQEDSATEQGDAVLPSTQQSQPVCSFAIVDCQDRCVGFRIGQQDYIRITPHSIEILGEDAGVNPVFAQALLQDWENYKNQPHKPSATPPAYVTSQPEHSYNPCTITLHGEEKEYLRMEDGGKFFIYGSPAPVPPDARSRIRIVEAIRSCLNDFGFNSQKKPT